MKPIRVRMTHALVVSYGICDELDVFRPRRANFNDMTRFHAPEYIRFLQLAGRDVKEPIMGIAVPNKAERDRFGIGEDCPVFDDIFEYAGISAGGTISAAERINAGLADVAVNWAGGMHHARRDSASGFCYVADCVLGILELLKVHARVMYIDIDIHHGDGVEEAFYETDRVMTVSFHKYGGGYFPGTGNPLDVGAGPGRFYSVNVPLRDGVCDETYFSVFETIIGALVRWYRPGGILLQCGADSLNGDRVGVFNLSTRGHGACVEFVRSFGIPLVVVGGGGYTRRSVARCWCYETALLAGVALPDELPDNDYLPSFHGRSLHVEPAPERDDMNGEGFLENVIALTFEHMRHLPAAPGVQYTTIPSCAAIDEEMEAPRYQRRKR